MANNPKNGPDDNSEILSDLFDYPEASRDGAIPAMGAEGSEVHSEFIVAVNDLRSVLSTMENKGLVAIINNSWLKKFGNPGVIMPYSLKDDYTQPWKELVEIVRAYETTKEKISADDLKALCTVGYFNEVWQTESTVVDTPKGPVVEEKIGTGEWVITPIPPMVEFGKKSASEIAASVHERLARQVRLGNKVFGPKK